MTIHIFNVFFHIRRIFPILFLTIIIASDSFAQESSNVSSIPKKGDKISRLYVEHLPTEIRGISVLWDFRDLVQIKDAVQVTYDSLPSHPNCITGIENDTRYYYAEHCDTLSVDGVENNYLHISYDMPLAELILPAVYGSVANGYFHGRGCYCDNILYRECGSYSIEADAEGSAVVSEGDTICDITRIHIIRNVSTIYYPSDSIGIIALSEQLNADSIANVVAKDTAVIRTDIYRWYSPNFRYPIAETQSLSRNGKEFYKTAFINYPENKEGIRHSIPNNSTWNKSGKNNFSTIEKGHLLPIFISDIRYCVNDCGKTKEISLAYRLLEKDHISMSLHSPNGSLLWIMPSSEIDAGSYSESIYLSNIQNGVYLLTIENERGKISKKIVIK